MANHIWGLIHHPDREWQSMNREHETVSHMYTHYVLWVAAIPVVSAFIGTTQFGWSFDGEAAIKISLTTGLMLGAAFYALILAAVAAVGTLFHWKTRKLLLRPSRQECIVFSGYVATPLFLSGIVAIYPIFWVCALACILGLCYSAYLLYAGTPNFLGISHKRGFIISTSTLCVGVLILEILMAIVVLLWSMGSEHSVVWHFF